MDDIAELTEQARPSGPLHEALHAGVTAVMKSVAAAAAGFILNAPVHAERHCHVVFESLITEFPWRRRKVPPLIFPLPRGYTGRPAVFAPPRPHLPCNKQRYRVIHRPHF
jgi:hypothetical protein